MAENYRGMADGEPSGQRIDPMRSDTLIMSVSLDVSELSPEAREWVADRLDTYAADYARLVMAVTGEKPVVETTDGTDGETASITVGDDVSDIERHEHRDLLDAAGAFEDAAHAVSSIMWYAEQ